MINPLEKLISFVSYWYFRYTLVTELYMVEKWERYFIHIFMLILFGLTFVFNYTVLLPTAKSLFIR
ncbi:serine palmitoyltransferase small subunit A [Microplitis demolitor]|uniref:serine palmitoyltransferase small subunit A n=1 Tax=Microplitis demolitor TaxID=69319 RepID=UPI0004CCEFA4|nr:serine palmitoyltransferase small subunit A [Microplitis demolitor]